jgi:hypothetical protein
MENKKGVGVMNKNDFIDKRTNIISKMLDNPDKNGIYPTTICYAELDDLYDELVNGRVEKSLAQTIRDEKVKTKKNRTLYRSLICPKGIYADMYFTTWSAKKVRHGFDAYEILKTEEKIVEWEE